MSEDLNKYNESVAALEGKVANFIENAKAGSDGRGSNSRSLVARKLSMEITNDLKVFRTLSIVNDKNKAVRNKA